MFNVLRLATPFVFALLLSGAEAAAQAIPADLLDMPVDIELQDLGPNGAVPKGSASGFFYDDGSSIFLITAKHVLFDLSSSKRTSEIVVLHSYVESADYSSQRTYILNRDVLAKGGNIRASNSDDVAAIRIATLSQVTPKTDLQPLPVGNGTKIIKIATDEAGVSVEGDLKTPVVAGHREQAETLDKTILGDPVYLIGYPKSLQAAGQKIDFSKPLLRSGVLAQKNSRLNSLVVDCATYKGNSGGPVIEATQVNLSTKFFYVIGVVTEFVPLIDNLISTDYGFHDVTIENSGYAIVVPMNSVFDLLAEFSK